MPLSFLACSVKLQPLTSGSRGFVYVAFGQICGKNPATVHFREIHDNKMSEIHVCKRCAEEKGMHTPAQQHKFEIADLLAGMVDAMTQTDEERVGHVQCPRCDMLYSAFKETGRLGCAECYQAFQFQLRPLLRRIHGDARHKGKAPIWPLAAGLGLLLAPVLLLRPDTSHRPEQVNFEEVQDVIHVRCAGCHAAKPSFAGIAEAPKGVLLDTPERIRAQAALIHQQSVLSRAMPPGNLTALTEEERRLLDRWYRAR